MSTIFVADKERHVLIGWGALKEFSKLTNRSFGQVFEVSDLGFDDLEKLFFVGLKWGAKKAGEDFDVKESDISEWLDDDMGAFMKFMDVFQEQLSILNSDDEKN